MTQIVKAGAQLDLVVAQGNDFTLTCSVTENNLPYSWAGATISASIVSAQGSTLVTTWATSTPADGALVLNLDHIKTGLLSLGRYLWQVTITKAGDSATWLAGSLTIIPNTTPAASTTQSSTIVITASASTVLNVTTVTPGAASVTLNPASGQYQAITLTTPTCAVAFTAVTAPWTVVLDIVQDGTGSRQVTWPAAVVWPSNSIPLISTTANSRSQVTFTSTDGTTIFGNTRGANPGVDPATIPGVTHVFDAATQPQAFIPSTNLATIYNRVTGGANLVKGTTGPGLAWWNPQTSNPAAPIAVATTRPLTPGLATLPVFDFSNLGGNDANGTNAYTASGVVNLNPATGYTIIVGMQQRSTVHTAGYFAVNDGAGHLLEFTRSTSGYPFLVNAGADAQVIADFTAQLAPMVLTLQVAPGGAGTIRWNGTTPTGGVTFTAPTQTLNTLVLNRTTRYGTLDGATLFGSIIIANTPLTATQVQQIERWAGAAIGLVMP